MLVGIIGGGESGVGAALLAQEVGHEPFVSDYGSLSPVYHQNLIENKVRFEEGGHSFDILVASELIVKSPGVRDNTPILKRLRAEGIPIISELEYAWNYCRGKIIAITGSNGKTTTTNLIHHLLKTSGKNVAKGGNLGTCLSSLLLEEAYDIYVIEVSSFQLDGIVDFRPDIAILTNISPDHLDRYDYNFDMYADSKIRITMNQKSSDTFIYDDTDSMILKRLSVVEAIKAPISQVSLDRIESSVSNPFLRGRHNKQNMSYAIEAVRSFHIDEDQIIGSLNTFKNDDHRLQSVARINKVEWINDSKATNVDATYYALDAFTDPIIWIVGGVDKGNDYNQLLKLVTDRVKVLIFLGADNKSLVTAFGGLSKKIVEVRTMMDAIEIADHNAVEGDVVLLSPACASFDLFKNYKDRGNQFVSGVWKLLRKRR